VPVIDIPSTSLDNESDVIDWLRNELVTNHHFTERRNTGTIGANDKEVWIERDAADTFHGDRGLVFGMRKFGSSETGGTFEHAMTYLDWATASNAGANAWDDIDGVHTKEVNASTASTFPCRMNRFTQGSPYVRGRLITSPDSDSASPTAPLYFYVVIEVETGFFRSFGFGEVVKLVPFTGGMFELTTHWEPSESVDSSTQLFGVGTLSTILETFISSRYPGGVWSEDWQGISLANLATQANNGWMTLGGGSDSSPGWPIATLHPGGTLAFLIGYSPSGFSLVSQRWPQLLYGPLGESTGTSPGYEGHAPMAIIPDVFLAEISSVDAYSVFQDQFGEKFMVVPYHTKTGEGQDSSEKWGFLIRNPDLVVT